MIKKRVWNKSKLLFLIKHCHQFSSRCLFYSECRVHVEISGYGLIYNTNLRWLFTGIHQNWQLLLFVRWACTACVLLTLPSGHERKIWLVCGSLYYMGVYGIDIGYYRLQARGCMGTFFGLYLLVAISIQIFYRFFFLPWNWMKKIIKKKFEL